MADLPPIVQHAVDNGFVDASGFHDYQNDGDIAMNTFLSDMPFIGNYFGAEAELQAQNKEMAYQEYMMDKGNAFNEYMYDKNAAWNSEQSRFVRMTEAGVNPAAAAQALAGNTSSINAPSSASASSAPHLDPAIGAAAAEIAKVNAETENLKTQTAELPRVNDAVIQEALSKSKLNDRQREQMEDLYDTLKQTNIQQLDNLKKDYLLLVENIKIAKQNHREAAARAEIAEFEAKQTRNNVDMHAPIWNNILSSVLHFGDQGFVKDGLNDLMDALGAPSIDEQEDIVTDRYIERHKDKYTKRILSPEERHAVEDRIHTIKSLLAEPKPMFPEDRKKLEKELVRLQQLIN